VPYNLNNDLVNKRIHTLAAIMILIAFLWQILSYLGLEVNVSPDDAFIAFGYARNLALGKGLTFDGHLPTFGFTSPAHVLLLSIFGLFGIPPTPLAEILSIAGIAVAAFGLYFVSTYLTSQIAAIFIALFFVFDGVGSFSFLGMETGLLLACSAPTPFCWWCQFCSWPQIRNH